MKNTRFTHWFVRLAIIALAPTIGAGNAGAQQATTYEIVSSFDGIFANGRTPRTLIQGRDGTFYGTTAIEGLLGGGTIFNLDAAGVLTTLHHFSGRDGSSPPPNAMIQATDGSLYGTTFTGGTFDSGTVFRLDPTGRFTTLHSFSPGAGVPRGRLVQGSTGTIFGLTSSGVFQLNPEGGITTLNPVFDAKTLVQAADGSLYGTTGRAGGGFGTVFKRDPSGTLTTVHTFTNEEGAEAQDFILGGDGNFYGVTVGVTGSDGTIFKMDPAGTLTTLHRFSDGRPEVISFAANLIQGSDGNLYGTRSDGLIFRFDASGMLTPLSVVTSGGILIQASDGSFYGFGAGLGGTTIFRLDQAGTVSVLYEFVRNPGPARPVAPVTEGSDGRLYGTTETGGPSNFGTVFAIEPSGATGILHSFTTSGARGPRSGLIQATDGRLYGTTSGGINSSGGGNWTIFAIDATGALTTRYAFPAIATGQNPGGYRGGAPNGVIQATDGRLYGTTERSVFSLPLSGAAPDFVSIDSGTSNAALIQASDGTFYGTTHSFSSPLNATIFSVNAGVLATRYTFSGPDGNFPRSRLAEGLDGSLYGTTYAGGAFGLGTIFRFDPAGTLTTLHHFGGADGANPYAGLLLATDGRWYGTTRNGGAFGFGTIFSIDATGTLTTLHSFAATDGAFPAADLIQASDGHLYGTTEIGGPAGGGVVFRVRLGTTPPPTNVYFELVSRNSGKCLDVSGGSTDAGASTIQWTCHGGPNQQWRLEPASGGAFRIISRNSGQALDVSGGSFEDVAPIIQWPVTGGDNQAWTLEPAGDGYVRLVVRHSGKAMDVEFGSTDDGAAVIQYQPHGGANQQWLLRPVE